MEPRKLDRALVIRLVEQHGDADVVAALHARDGWPDNDPSLTGGIEDLDDFSACRIARKEDWVDLYVKPFYFGCEADDRANGWAFSKHNPFGARAARALQLRHRPLRRDRHARSIARSLRAGRTRRDQRRQLPRLHVRQRRAPLGRRRIRASSRARRSRRRPPRSWHARRRGKAVVAESVNRARQAIDARCTCQPVGRRLRLLALRHHLALHRHRAAVHRHRAVPPCAACRAAWTRRGAPRRACAWR